MGKACSSLSWSHLPSLGIYENGLTSEGFQVCDPCIVATETRMHVMVQTFGLSASVGTTLESLVIFSQHISNNAFIIALSADVYSELSKIHGPKLEMRWKIKHGPVSAGTSR